MPTNRENLKEYFNAGDRPTENQFAELIDNVVNKIDDKANLTEAVDENNDEKFITPKTAKKAIETHLPNATISDAGIVRRASVTEAEQGLDINAYVTPLGAKKATEAFAPVKSVNGLTGDILLPTNDSSNFILFSGRYYFYTDNRWISPSPVYGSAGQNNNYSRGVGTNPSVVWDTLGIGFLPQGAILNSLEFIGKVDNADVTNVQVQLSCLGNNLDGNGGYSSLATALNEVILSPTNITPISTNLNHVQRFEISLGDYVLDRNRIIDFCCKPEGTLATNRYWMIVAKLHYTLP